MLKELCHPSTALFVRGKSFCTRSSTLWNGEHCLKINNYYNISTTFRRIFSIFDCVSGGGYCPGGYSPWLNVHVVNVRGGGLISAHPDYLPCIKTWLKRCSAIDFKKFVFSEISNIKSVKSPAKTDFMPTSDKEETLLVSVLQGQIRSLERQLDDKQRIIESLLNCQQNFVRGVSSVNVGQTNSCENTDITQDIKFKSTNNSNKAIKINVDANDHMGKANDERISIKSNNSVNINDRKGKANEERAVISNNNNTNCKKNIIIVGDSIINNIDAKGLGRNHNIKVRSYGGATTRDMVDHIM